MLIPFGPEHFNYIIDWVDTPELMFRYSGPDFPYPWTKEMLQGYIDEVHDRERFMFSAHNELIGYGEVLYNGEFQPRLGRLLIGPRAHRGKGNGAQMIKELVEYCKKDDSDQRVYLYVFTDNEPAIRSYSLAGFEKTVDDPIYQPHIDKHVWLMHID